MRTLLMLESIFIAIEIKYGIDLQGVFLSDKRFTNCFLYCQNKDSFQFSPNTRTRETRDRAKIDRGNYIHRKMFYLVTRIINGQPIHIR